METPSPFITELADYLTERDPDGKVSQFVYGAIFGGSSRVITTAHADNADIQAAIGKVFRLMKRIPFNSADQDWKIEATTISPEFGLMNADEVLKALNTVLFVLKDLRDQFIYLKKNCRDLSPNDAVRIYQKKVWRALFQFLHHLHSGDVAAAGQSLHCMEEEIPRNERPYDNGHNDFEHWFTTMIVSQRLLYELLFRSIDDQLKYGERPYMMTAYLYVLQALREYLAKDSHDDVANPVTRTVQASLRNPHLLFRKPKPFRIIGMTQQSVRSLTQNLIDEDRLSLYT